jgi:hypothetical protein
MARRTDRKESTMKTLQMLSMVALLTGLAAPALAGPGDGGGDDPNYWVRMGLEQFEGGMDRESATGGWAGRSIDTIGLRALNTQARCTRVRAEFGNGRTRDLDASSLFHMMPGRLYRIDLPGGDRNVVKLHLACRSLTRYAVNVQILARK